MDLSEIGLEAVNWIHPTRDRDLLRVLFNTAINFWFHKRRAIY
jgi:hypothetical protein